MRLLQEELRLQNSDRRLSLVCLKKNIRKSNVRFWDGVMNTLAQDCGVVVT